MGGVNLAQSLYWTNTRLVNLNVQFTYQMSAILKTFTVILVYVMYSMLQSPPVYHHTP